jgi:hypothetical protein
MQLEQNLIDDGVLDSILEEAAEGYGDLMAASLVHRVSLKALQSRLSELQGTGSPWTT